MFSKLTLRRFVAAVLGVLILFGVAWKVRSLASDGKRAQPWEAARQAPQ